MQSRLWVLAGLAGGIGACATVTSPWQQARELQAAGQLESALAAYARAADQEPQRAEIYLEWGDALQAKGLSAEALRAWELAFTRAPQGPARERLAAAYVAKGRQARLAGKITDAYEYWQKALAVDPGNADALYELQKITQPQPAASPVATAASPAQPGPQSFTAAEYFKQGEDSSKRGDYSSAVSAFQEALRRDPKDPQSAGQLGLAYFHQGYYAQARKIWEHALQNHPGIINHDDSGVRGQKPPDVSRKGITGASAPVSGEPVVPLKRQPHAAIQKYLDDLAELGY